MAPATPYFFLDNRSAVETSHVLAIGVTGMSVLVLTGRAGLRSLGQFAVAGARRRRLGEGRRLPGLREKGMVLAITTLAARSWLDGRTPRSELRNGSLCC